MKQSLQLLRQAQWRWDFVAASHGSTFHAPVETQRILAHSLDRTMLAQLALQKVLFALNIKEDVPMPDISTKAKAQQYIGLDMKTLIEKKEAFKKEVIPLWIKKTEEKTL